LDPLNRLELTKERHPIAIRFDRSSHANLDARVALVERVHPVRSDHKTLLPWLQRQLLLQTVKLLAPVIRQQLHHSWRWNEQLTLGLLLHC